MKLADFELTERDEHALRIWLVRFAQQLDEERAIKDRQRESNVYATMVYEKLVVIAKDTARRIGLVRGIHPVYLARVAWSTFVDNESFQSTYDVDEHWTPDSDDAETWELAYTNEFRQMEREAKPR